MYFKRPGQKHYGDLRFLGRNQNKAIRNERNYNKNKERNSVRNKTKQRVDSQIQERKIKFK